MVVKSPTALHHHSHLFCPEPGLSHDISIASFVGVRGLASYNRIIADIISNETDKPRHKRTDYSDSAPSPSLLATATPPLHCQQSHD